MNEALSRPPRRQTMIVEGPGAMNRAPSKETAVKDIRLPPPVASMFGRLAGLTLLLGSSGPSLRLRVIFRRLATLRSATLGVLAAGGVTVTKPSCASS